MSLRAVMLQPHFLREYKDTPWGNPWLATKSMLEMHGINIREVSWVARSPGSFPCDFAVVYGWKKRQFPKKNDHIDWFLKHRVPLLVIELGFLGNRDAYRALMWNGLNGVAEWGHIYGMPSDRFDALGISIEPWKPPGEFALVVGQIPNDASVCYTDYRHWWAYDMRNLGMPTRFRPHPKTGKGLKFDPLAVDLRGCDRVVTYNSTAAIECVLAGYPTVAYHRCSMAWAVTGRRWDDVVRPEREQWAYDLAYKQWSIEEIERGVPWDLVKLGLE